MRHAKAEQVGPTDHERELAAQGLADSLVAGSWLSEQGIDPQHALVSAAVRTRQTWEGVARGPAGTWCPPSTRASTPPGRSPRST